MSDEALKSENERRMAALSKVEAKFEDKPSLNERMRKGLFSKLYGDDPK
jgi:hypothetical protein